MILSARAPLEPFGRPLRALYVALNSPVVTLESLSRGPASAAVALHEAGASLCVRSVRTGQVRFFATTEELAGERRVALDAALSFAESMGFLFDDDEVAARGDAGADEAAVLWQELCGEGAAPSEPAEPAEPAQPEILLDELVAGEPPPAEPEPDDSVPEPAEEPPADEVAVVPPALVLSKFRRAGAHEPRPAADDPPDVRLGLVSRF